VPPFHPYRRPRVGSDVGGLAAEHRLAELDDVAVLVTVVADELSPVPGPDEAV
jgi:hypothetical protein